MEQDVGIAITLRDWVTLDRLIADDFINTNSLGQVMTKKEALAALTSPDYELELLSNDEINIRLFGDAAVASAVGTVKGRHRGQEVSGQFRYLRVWVKRQGRWHAVAAQATNLLTGTGHAAG